MTPEETRYIVINWVQRLRSGDGDYKKVYTEDMMILLQSLNAANIADIMLLKEMQQLRELYAKKNY